MFHIFENDGGFIREGGSRTPFRLSVFRWKDGIFSIVSGVTITDLIIIVTDIVIVGHFHLGTGLLFIRRRRHADTPSSLRRQQGIIIALALGPSDPSILRIEINIVPHHGIGPQDAPTRFLDVKPRHVILIVRIVLEIMRCRDGQHDILGIVRGKDGPGISRNVVRISRGIVSQIGIVARQYDENGGETRNLLRGEIDRGVGIVFADDLFPGRFERGLQGRCEVGIGGAAVDNDVSIV
mmetsp:Transcript_4692/g.9572  ORF Transcript_4692/g.9572 Transcript_4692/m.9572 type:complete len:238 (-) Transcript_4692:1344-2057(-)